MHSIVTDFKLSDHTKTTEAETMAKHEKKVISPSMASNQAPSERSFVPKKVFRHGQVDTMIKT